MGGAATLLAATLTLGGCVLERGAEPGPDGDDRPLDAGISPRRSARLLAPEGTTWNVEFTETLEVPIDLLDGEGAPIEGEGLLARVWPADRSDDNAWGWEAVTDARGRALFRLGPWQTLGRLRARVSVAPPSVISAPPLELDIFVTARDRAALTVRVAPYEGPRRLASVVVQLVPHHRCGPTTHTLWGLSGLAPPWSQWLPGSGNSVRFPEVPATARWRVMVLGFPNEPDGSGRRGGEAVVFGCETLEGLEPGGEHEVTVRLEDIPAAWRSDLPESRMTVRMDADSPALPDALAEDLAGPALARVAPEAGDDPGRALLLRLAALRRYLDPEAHLALSALADDPDFVARLRDAWTEAAGDPPLRRALARHASPLARLTLTGWMESGPVEEEGRFFSMQIPRVDIEGGPVDCGWRMDRFDGVRFYGWEVRCPLPLEGVVHALLVAPEDAAGRFADTLGCEPVGRWLAEQPEASPYIRAANARAACGALAEELLDALAPLLEERLGPTTLVAGPAWAEAETLCRNGELQVRGAVMLGAGRWDPSAPDGAVPELPPVWIRLELHGPLLVGP